MNKKVFKLIALILSLTTFISLISINAAAYIRYPETEFDESIWDGYGLYVEDIANNLNNLGDANLDNKVSIADARLILREITKLTELDEKQTFAADVNQDGKVSIADARQVLRVVVGLDCFRINVELEVGQEYVTDPMHAKGGLFWTYKVSPEAGLDVEEYVDDKFPSDPEIAPEGCPSMQNYKFIAKAPGTYEVRLTLALAGHPDIDIYRVITYTVTVK